MTANNLFNMILKVLGLLLLMKTVEILVPEIFQLVGFLKDLDTAEAAISVLSLFSVLTVYLLFTYLFIFKSSYIISKLRLTSGFDESLSQINMSAKVVLSISVFIVGGLILVDAIPSLCRSLYNNYIAIRISHGMAKFDTSSFIFFGAKIIIGLLIIGEQKRIVNYFASRSEPSNTDSN